LVVLAYKLQTAKLSTTQWNLTSFEMLANILPGVPTLALLRSGVPVLGVTGSDLSHRLVGGFMNSE